MQKLINQTEMAKRETNVLYLIFDNFKIVNNVNNNKLF